MAWNAADTIEDIVAAKAAIRDKRRHGAVEVVADAIKKDREARILFASMVETIEAAVAAYNEAAEKHNCPKVQISRPDESSVRVHDSTGQHYFALNVGDDGEVLCAFATSNKTHPPDPISETELPARLTDFFRHV
jgi:hypothetical protein